MNKKRVGSSQIEQSPLCSTQNFSNSDVRTKLKLKGFAAASSSSLPVVSCRRGVAMLVGTF